MASGGNTNNSSSDPTEETLETLSSNRLNIPISNNTSEKLELPINSLLHYCSSSPAPALSYYINPVNNIDNNNSLMADVITYPWEFLNAVGSVLQNEVIHTIISSTDFYS